MMLNKYLKFSGFLSIFTLLFLWGIIFLDYINRVLIGAKHTRYYTGKYLIISLGISLTPCLLYFLYKKFHPFIPKIIKIFQRKLQHRAVIITSFTIFLLVFGYVAFFARMGVDIHHDGIVFKTALDMANGSRIFRDTFSQFNGLAAVIQSLSLMVFGHYLIVIKLLTAVHYGVIGVFLWLIWRRFLPDILSLLSLIIWLIMAPYIHNTFLAWPSVYALFWHVLSLYFFIKYLEKDERPNNKLWGILCHPERRDAPDGASRSRGIFQRRNDYLFLTGISVALCYLCRQTTGFFIIFSYIVYFLFLAVIRKKCQIKNPLKDMLILALGILVILSGYFLWLISSGSLSDWWKQTIEYAYFFGKIHGQGFQITAILSNLLAVDNSVVWMRLPVINLILLTVTKYTKPGAFSLLALLTVNLASWMQYYPVAEDRHFYWAATPMVGIAVLFAFKLSVKLAEIEDNILTKLLGGIKQILKEFAYRFFGAVSFLSLMFLLFGPIIKDRIAEAGNKLSKDYTLVQTPAVLKGMLLTREDGKYFRHVEDLFNQYFRKYPDDKLVNVGIEVFYQTIAPPQKNIHPLYSDLRVNDLLYADFTASQSAYIEKNLPLVLSDREYFLKGYCEVPGSEGYKDFVLYASCQKLRKSSQKFPD